MPSEAAIASVMQIASLFLIAYCIFSVSSLLAGLAYLGHRKYTANDHFQINNKWLIFHALSAVSASIVVTLWLSLPQSSRLPFVFKHCHRNDCETHIPAIIDFTLLNLIFIFFAISMISVCFMLIRAHQKKLEGRIDSLLRLSKTQHNIDNEWSQAAIIYTPQPVLLNVGMLTPKLLLSSKVVETLDVNDVKLLLAYEYAKAKQFENLKIKLVQIVCLFWPTPFRRFLIIDLRSVLHARATREICQLLGNPKTNIPETMLNKMPNDIGLFVAKMDYKNGSLPSTITNINNEETLNITELLTFSLYFICLVTVTSNFTHFLFELIG
ncbi:MAG: hypothetical protein ACI9IT_002404 [Glaciecola sp.]|jgi:hypothetical protein